MTDPNYEYVQKGLQLLRLALMPYAARMFKQKYGDSWWTQGVMPHLQRMEQLRNRLPLAVDDASRLDLLDSAALLNLMDKQYGEVFSKDLGREGLGYVHELAGVRNHWAHEDHFSQKAAVRAVDTIILLLGQINAPELGEAEKLQSNFLVKGNPIQPPFIKWLNFSRRKAILTAGVIGLAGAIILFALGNYFNGTSTRLFGTSPGTPTATVPIVLPSVSPSVNENIQETQTTSRPEQVEDTVASCSCQEPDLDCRDFKTHKEAQVCFDVCKSRGFGDVYLLDSNNDGTACTSLP